MEKIYSFPHVASSLDGEGSAFNNRSKKKNSRESFHVTSLSNFFQFASFTHMFVLQTVKLNGLDSRRLFSFSYYLIRIKYVNISNLVPRVHYSEENFYTI